MICGSGFLLQALRSYDASTRPFVRAAVAERCGKSEQKASEFWDEDCRETRPSGTERASVSNKIERECQECGKHTCQIERSV